MSVWKPWNAFVPSLLSRGGGRALPPAVSRSAALDGAELGRACRVVSVQSPDAAPDWARWLAEIGFVPGERVTVTARARWGGDPLVVRVGQSCFALRRAEAACVRVEPLPT